jgi:hypothetical protein
VEEVIRARPNNLVALYTNAKAVLTVRERGESWLEKPGASGPSIIWPHELIDEFLEWQDRHIDRIFEWDTVRVSMWLIKIGVDWSKGPSCPVSDTSHILLEWWQHCRD